MTDYPNIRRVLATVFNCEDGLSLDVAKRLYARSVAASPAGTDLRRELAQAIEDLSVSWRQMLCNESYEVLDADSEEEARAFAIELLWEPLQAAP
jgi:hypothetical protein